MPSAKTVTGSPFEYSGSLATGLTVSFKSSEMRITAKIIRVIRSEITKRSPVLMGANRQPLVADSVGETLAQQYDTTPQVMSYVLPLLIEEGFCRASGTKPIVIYKN